METILHANAHCNLKYVNFVCLFAGIHLFHSQVQNPFGITAVWCIQLYHNLMCVFEYVKHLFVTLVL
jgi:hypothetical protein